MVHFHKTTRLSQRSSTATSRVAQNAVKDRLLNGNRVFMFAHVRILVSILSVLCALCGQSLAQEWKTVADGVEYAEVRREFSGKPVNINLLRLDLKKVRLDVHHAMDAAIGTEKTSSIATRHKAFAAINAGFFRLDTSIWAGDAVGTLMTDKKLLSESKNGRIAIAISNLPDKTDVTFAHLEYGLMVVDNKSGGIELHGINRQRLKNEVLVYTPEFGRSTLTDPTGVEIVVLNGRVKDILRGGSSKIPTNGFVISADGKEAEALYRQWRLGSRVQLNLIQPQSMLDDENEIDEKRKRDERLSKIDPDLVARIEDITNGVPQLIKNSKIDITWEQEKSSKAFVETRHPRTAVAKLKDGKFLMLTADGRTEQSAGLDLYDLAAYFLELGATDAMNLDGGGSTTMFLDGKVVNKPSDPTGERKVGDAILVTLRKPVKGKK